VGGLWGGGGGGGGRGGGGWHRARLAFRAALSRNFRFSPLTAAVVLTSLLTLAGRARNAPRRDIAAAVLPAERAVHLSDEGSRTGNRVGCARCFLALAS